MLTFRDFCRSLVILPGRLNPRVTIGDPLLFALEVAATAATVVTLADFVSASAADASFAAVSAAGLWALVALVVGTTFGLGRRRPHALERAAQRTPVKRLSGWETGDRRSYELVTSDTLVPGDLVLVEANETIPADGTVVAGVAAVDESPITGESAPVIRDDTRQRSTVVGGTDVISDWLVVKVTAAPGAGFFQTIAPLIEQAHRSASRRGRLVAIGTVAATVIAVAALARAMPVEGAASLLRWAEIMVALFAALLPVSAVILPRLAAASGVRRLLRSGIVAKSTAAAGVAGRIDTVLVDKTGTITLGDRQAHALFPLPGVTANELAEAASLASVGDDTPEGRSVIAFARDRYGIVADQPRIAAPIAFSAQTRISGARLTDGSLVRKGASDAVLAETGQCDPSATLQSIIQCIGQAGFTPLVVTRDRTVLGVVSLKDTVKPGLQERFAQLRRMGVRTVMITGDNPRTAATIAAECGVDDFVAQASPATKVDVIRAEQAAGKVVAMCGDGINDAPALAQANVGVAMGLGSPAAGEAGNMIDLDGDPFKIMEVIRTGRWVSRRVRALTIFGIACDTSKALLAATALIAPQVLRSSGLNGLADAASCNVALSGLLFTPLVFAALLPLAIGPGPRSSNNAAATPTSDARFAAALGLLAPIAAMPLIASTLAAIGLAVR